MKRLFQRISLLMLLCAASSLLSSATKSLNQAYLVPGGLTKIDKQLLKTERKFCALTFDDGPDSRYTMQVHDILRDEGIRATFFVVGRNVDRFPEQVIALAEYGHEIGNHSYTHKDMLTLSKAQIRKEIDDTDAVLAKLGITAHWFRPPYGSFNRTVVDLVADSDLDTMLWSVDPLDWKRPGASVIRKRVVDNTGPGAVVLMHSTVSQTVEALPGIIADLRAEGYTFVTASEWQQLVSGKATLENLKPGSDYSLPLNLREPPVTESLHGESSGSGTLSGGMPADADVWQRVPAGRSGSAERRLKVYANFIDDNDLRRVLDEGGSRNLIASESAVGNGLLRVLEGLPPQQIVAVVEEPAARPTGRGSVEVQIADTPVVQNGELIAAAANEAAAEQTQTATPAAAEAEHQPALNVPAAAAPERPQGPVALGSSSELSINLASREYAASVASQDDGRFAFVSYAGSPDAMEWGALANYMRLCGLENFGYASGYSTGRAPADFPFSAAADQQGRSRLELGMFNPARFLDDYSDSAQYFIPLRSTDFSKLDTASLFGAAANGYREFMLIRSFSAGMQATRETGLPTGNGLSTMRFSDGSRSVLIVAAPRPGIELQLPQEYQSWQQLIVDERGRVESRDVTDRLTESGRLLILISDSGE
ncbi:polysaccharide deacetylase family protein [bacterium]|nr:polysaccharide deacetylase family protein [bacterium]